MPIPLKPTYLGDGVYISPLVYDSGGIILTTGTHEQHLAPNRIVLESDVLQSLIRTLKVADLLPSTDA